MNREEFNQLDVKGQVDHFNNELKQENNNFNAICKQLGISKANEFITAICPDA